MSKLNFRGRNKNQEYDEAKENAVKTVYKPKRNEGIGVPYQKYIDDKNIEVNEMNSIDPEIINQARQAEDLRRNPWRGENCPENAKNCIIGALTWAFPTKSNTIKYDSEKKNNGGKKSRKSHNSKKSRKSKKSRTTYKRSRR
jgi:hypothetical protein